jgi:hypothetical protein
MIALEGNTRTVDLLDRAERMIEAAVAVTTGRMHLDAPQEARALLFQGDERAVLYFRHELGRQIASALLMMDQQVISVFEDQDVPDSEEEIPPATRLADPLRLFVRVEFETPVIIALVSAIGESLSHALVDAMPHQPHGFIQATIITDANSRLLRSRAHGYRPVPVLLGSRAGEPAGEELAI